MDNSYSFYATLTANVFLSDEDFYFICDVCKNHYDYKVRESISVGGFLYGFKTRRTQIKGLEITNEDRIVEFTSRQLGLIMKSFEMQRCDKASILNLMFHKIASEMAIKQFEINKNL